jgi:hypothetical protein
MIAIDLDKVKAAARNLKSKPPTHAEIAQDPKAFLAQHGVSIDDSLSAAIKSKIAKAPAAKVQAATIHIDV